MKKSITLFLAISLFGCSDSTGNNSKTNNQNNQNNTNNSNNTNNTGNNTNNSNGEGLVINEIVAAGDPNDWAEIFNASEDTIDLTGMTFSDQESEPGKSRFNGTIAPGEYIVLNISTDTTGYNLGAGEQFGIFRGAETVDFVDWERGDSLAEKSFGRIPNGTGPFVRLNTPTQGAANVSNDPNDPLCGDSTIEGTEVCDLDEVGAATCDAAGFSGGTLGCGPTCGRFDFSDCGVLGGDVVINELVGSGDDQIELFNSGGASVDISGWYITDRGYTAGDETHRYVFSNGTSIDGGEFLVLVKGTDHTFGVGGGDELTLFNDADEVVDFISWRSPDADVSLCRQPDGGDFGKCDAASFGASNGQ